MAQSMHDSAGDKRNGEILIELDGEAHAYGKGLKEEEARVLASLLQQEMMMRSGYRRPSEVRAG